MSSVNLNLARKWRSRNFDQIVGQELSIRMLKNSLYLDQYFPVYLFSGQRGCGKTTTGRVFAAAVNCERLADFRTQPKTYTVPCLTCASCLAMLAGKHPDFIEIDAASHTGVDNVRQIIDDSQLLPLMGRKKIYLIDEAHMLSKAAFNAFLKVLEEPPASVLFILATTDEQKIIETVRSRCFQLFFKSVGHDPLLNHLKNVCDTEKIPYEDLALSLVIKETQGSVRDALNVLEQVKFARGRVTKEAVLQVLGHLDDATMIELFEIVLNKRPQDLFTCLQALQFNSCAAEFVWNKLAELTRAAIWIHYGVKPDWAQHYVQALEKATRGCSVIRLNEILKLLYANEAVFAKTAAKHSLLELILLQICQKNSGDTGNAGSAPVSQSVAACVSDSEPLETDSVTDEDGGQDEPDSIEEDEGKTCAWQKFLTALVQLNDPLLISVFKNGSVIQHDETSGELMVMFAKQFSFFKETISETTSAWLPHLQATFGSNVIFNPQFTGQSSFVKTMEDKRQIDKVEPKSSIRPSEPAQASEKRPQYNSGYSHQQRAPYNSSSNRVTRATVPHKPIDISDADVWKKANMIARYFPGSFSELYEAQS